MANSSASFMGTLLASSLGSPPSHPPHPARPPSSPSSPQYRGNPHSNSSQIWFSHSHEDEARPIRVPSLTVVRAAISDYRSLWIFVYILRPPSRTKSVCSGVKAVPGYPHFSGSLAHTFLPISHLDHHANSGVIYGQHRFYDTQKENFYLRSLPSQPPLVTANQNIQAVSRAGTGQAQGSCSRDRDSGSGGSLHKSLKEPSLERDAVSAAKDKDRASSKHGKDRHHHHLPHQQSTHLSPLQQQHHHHHHHHAVFMEEMISRGHKASLPLEYKEQNMGKPLSACLLNGKVLHGDHVLKGSMTSYSEEGVGRANIGSSVVHNRHMTVNGNGRCGKPMISGEMQISEQQQTDCLERCQTLQHSLQCSAPPPLPMATAYGEGNPDSFHCVQLHPPHHNRLSHHHSDFFCSPPSVENASIRDKVINLGGCRTPKVAGTTFVPSASNAAEKARASFQMGNLDCQGVRAGGNSVKDKALEKNGNGLHQSHWPRKHQSPQQQQLQHPYRKSEKSPGWMDSHNILLQQQSIPQQNQTERSSSASGINSLETDIFNSRMNLEPKAVHLIPNQSNVIPQVYRDCSHSRPPGIPSPLTGKTMTQHTVGLEHGSCSVQRDGQKVARIRHQQHSKAVPDTHEMAQANTNREMKQLEKSPYSYNTVQHHPHQQISVPPWAMQPHHTHPEENPHKAYMETNGGPANNRQPSQHQHQTAGMGPPPPLHSAPPPQVQQEATSSQRENSATKNLLKYNQHPHPQSQKSPFGGLGSLKTGPNGTNCNIQGGKQTLPSRKGQSHEGDCGGRGRAIGEAVELEVRQPPVGIAVAVARQRDPTCQAPGSHPSSREARVHSTMKGPPPMYSSDFTGDEERKRTSAAHMGPRCTERERDTYIRENKDRVEFAHVHPSSSCHGDLTSHIMVPGGTSMPSGEPSAHTHPAHNHWMPRTGSPSLWMSGHSYGIGHAALHQNLPPGFSAAMPAPLQPVLPLPQDPSAQLVVLPSEPAPRQASHLEVMEQPGLWPPVYRAPGSHSHMHHPSVYPHSQFLRQQGLYALQQHSSQPASSAHTPRPENHTELQQRGVAEHQQVQRLCSSSSRDLLENVFPSIHVMMPVQKKPEEQHLELEALLSEPSTPKPAKCYAYVSSSSPQRGFASHRSPCCQSPCMQPHPKSTPSTPSSKHSLPHSPSPIPAPSQLNTSVESQEKIAERTQEYPPSMEPDLPSGFAYPEINMAYSSSGPSQDVQLSPPAALPAETVEASAQGLSDLVEVLEPHAMVRPRQETAIATDHVLEEQTPGVFEEAERVETDATVGEVIQESKHMEIFGEVADVEKACSLRLAEEIPTATIEENLDDVFQVYELQHDQEPCLQSQPSVFPNPTTPEEGSLVSEGDHEQRFASPVPSSGSKNLVHSYWSLELLIAAAFCGDCPPPSPQSSQQSQKCHAPIVSAYHGMELLSELADLELQCHHQSSVQSQEDRWMFDLQNLATLAAARALELGTVQSFSTDPEEKQFPSRKPLNLRRKCSWTPRHEPICPVKGSMDCMDAPELDMRVRLAELQQRYREKQRELAKLQRKHDHQREESPRSPARRGPGRPRKRKSFPGAGFGAFPEAQKKAKLVEAGVSSAAEEHGGGDSQNKKKKVCSRALGRPSCTQMKMPCFQKSSAHDLQETQLKQKIGAARQMSGSSSKDPESASKSLCSGSKRTVARFSTVNESESLSDTATSGDGGTQESWKRLKEKVSKRESTGLGTCSMQHRAKLLLRVGQDVYKDEETSAQESESSEQGSQFHAASEGLVKVKPLASIPISNPPVVRRRPGRPRLQDKRWTGQYRKSCSRLPFPTISSNSERLKRATRKTSMLRATRKSYWSSSAQCPGSRENSDSRRTRHRESKGRAVSRLMESFAADEGFHLDEDSSFSEEEEERMNLPKNNRVAPVDPLSCVLTKEMLTDGLKILISDEEELLYSAQLHRCCGGRARKADKALSSGAALTGSRKFSISLKLNCLQYKPLGGLQVLLHFNQILIPKSTVTLPLSCTLSISVLSVCPHSETVLTEGTRVCAYWSERSRCLYPGYVQKGAVSSFVLVPEVQPGKVLALGEKTARTERFKPQEKPVRKPGRPRGSCVKKSVSDGVGKNLPSIFPWPSVTGPRKRNPVSFFQLNSSAAKKTTKGKAAEISARASVSLATTSKALFSSRTFEVDSFSSIANGYSAFGTQTSGISRVGKNSANLPKKRLEDPARGRKAELLVKLDHEGVTAPKTKNSKALLLGASGFGSTGVGHSLPRAQVYSHPVLLIKDNKGDGSRAELLLKGAIVQKRPLMHLREYGDVTVTCHRDYQSSSSDLEEDEEKAEKDLGNDPLASASGGLRTAGQFLSQVSISSSSSGSSISSSSGSFSSSSLCSSENDSSYSSEEEDSSTLLLQSCLPPRHTLIQTTEPSPRHTFVAKAVAVSNGKSGDGNHITGSKPIKNKESQNMLSRSPKEVVKRQRLQSDQIKPRVPSVQPSRQLWRWSGNPSAQQQGLKGKAQKLFYKAVVRGKEMVRVGDCAVFFSSGLTHLPMIGRIQSFWQSWQSGMVVSVKWFYHAEETTLGKRQNNGKHALYQSCREEEKDVQTISHKCQVVTRKEYEGRGKKHSQDLYSLVGTYDPSSGQILQANGIL
ncbi:hypothetical protein DNTS_005342 [Danionella cerebrum]|uniref:BAH domain-containing protein n=1 Tax=Danionella cerebrum TaxID=2873325 RepID=A0A553ML51_9TELE|nr:hypothetical protein DNTS_005342 [Danionella translucida]